LVEGEKEERLEVVVADAVADPGAVMIHFRNTNLADRAVVGADRLPVAAVDAIVGLVRGRHLRNHLGSFERSDKVGPESHDDCKVEQDLDQPHIRLILHPFIHFIVHEVEGHRIEEDDDKSHGPDEQAADLVFAEHLPEDAVAKHTHLFLF